MNGSCLLIRLEQKRMFLSNVFGRGVLCTSSRAVTFLGVIGVVEVTGVGDLCRSLGSPDCDPVKTYHRRGVEPDPVWDTSAPKRQHARRSKRASTRLQRRALQRRGTCSQTATFAMRMEGLAEKKHVLPNGTGPAEATPKHLQR